MAKLVSRLNIIADAAESEMNAALLETADFILRMIRVFAPVDTGRLRSSYEIKQVTPLHLMIGSAVLYSIFQEFGTSRQSGTPHLIPAMLLGESELPKNMQKRLDKLK